MELGLVCGDGVLCRYPEGGAIGRAYGIGCACSAGFHRSELHAAAES